MKPTSASLVLLISLLNIRNVQSGTERVAALKIGSKCKVLRENKNAVWSLSIELNVHKIPFPLTEFEPQLTD